MSPSEFDRLWEQLSHDQKINHIAAVEHLTAKYGDKFGERFDIELKLLKGDRELAAVLQSDPPLTLPTFDENGMRVNDAAAGSFVLERELVEKADALHLGEVVAWIISRGFPVKSQDVVKKWDNTVEDVLCKIADKDITATGISQGAQRRVKPKYCGAAYVEFREVEILPTNSAGLLRTGVIRINFPGELPDEPPFKRVWRNVILPSADVLRLWPPSETQNASSEPENQALEGCATPKKKKGRPVSFDWPKFDAATLAILEHEGAFDPTVDLKWKQSELERRMAVWCQVNWRKEPAESTLRKRVTKVYAEYLKGRKG